MKYKGNELYHWGILGQKWGIRRYQNEDGSYTEEGLARLRQKDTKWAKRNYDKIYNKTLRKSKKELNKYVKKDLNKRMNMENASGGISKTYVNEYNRKMAEIMTKNASSISTPNLNLAIKFVAKRGNVGVEMIVSDQAYNINELKNGIYDTGRIAYKTKQVNIA